MAEMVTVKNVSELRVLVGVVYLLPGEQREVPTAHYQAAVGKDKLVVVGGNVKVNAKAEAEKIVPVAEVVVEDDLPEADTVQESAARRKGKSK